MIHEKKQTASALRKQYSSDGQDRSLVTCGTVEQDGPEAASRARSPEPPVSSALTARQPGQRAKAIVATGSMTFFMIGKRMS